MSAVLIHRLYVLQIINGENYRSNFSMKTTRTRTIKSTRGNIYDRNGKLLAYNELSYSLTIEDSGTYSSNRYRDLSLNGEAYRIANILAEHGDALSNDFHVVLDENGNYTYNVEGTSLARFKADVYGRAKISDLLPEEEESTADQMIAKLSGKDRGQSVYGGGAHVRRPPAVTHKAGDSQHHLRALSALYHAVQKIHAGHNRPPHLGRFCCRA